ncbi:hypothetical protein LTR70_004834 [Exophiala xenobiotica]|uniref:Uncharacterized protein n=1 Tax=Lithohypha guttulata TaxID=1690604 RepID=A0ABR0KBS2_9EURO|nr:hypothetical protein LTR24_004452 [Lithohypha guttulata]KAK5319790.1 hypothetical protein LTR70_004834 [Exophiala xenobiotica]
MDTRKFEPFKGEAYVPYAHARYHGILQGEVRDASPTPLTSWSQRALSKPRFGEPVAKKRLHVLDLLSIGTAFASLALAIAAVAVEEFAWRLGTKNRQLVVLGFLLSIMDMCLNNIAPTFFLLFKARFGSSTLQNYDGILRNSVPSSRLSFGFQGGESAITINATTYIKNASYYGMFAPPEIQGLGENTGISHFNNATLPFAVASAPQNGLELAVPAKPQPYGFNILLLNQNSTALLDVPQPSYVSGIQKLLTLGESWNLTAHGIGTVAAFNNSKDQDEDGYKSYFDAFCEAAADSSGAYAHQSMMNDRSLVRLSPTSFPDQSLQYIGLPPDPGIEWEVPRDTFTIMLSSTPSAGNTV